MSERGWTLALVVAACAAVHVCWVYESVPLQSANDRSRWSTVRALVEDDSYIIDRFQFDREDRSWQTIDLVRHEGHFYSTKPPLLTTMLASLVRGIEGTLGWTIGDETRDVTRLVLLLINAVPMAIALALLARMSLQHLDGTFGPVVVVLAAGLGTMHLPYIAVLNNHTIALWSAAFALAAANGFRNATRPAMKAATAFAAGLFAMWTCCNELPAALFGLIIFGWFVRENWRYALLWFAPAAIIPLAAFLWTNYEVTGGWKPFYMYYGTEKYEFEINGRPSYWSNPQGIDRNVDSPPMYALHCLIGHHGLFSLTPILLLAVAGVFAWWRHAAGWVRFWSVAAAVISLVVFGFFMTRTENYNYGGVSVALRWMLWITPLWAVLMMAALARFTHGVFRGLVVLLLTWSMFSAFEPGPNPWQHNYLFRNMTDAGWIDY